MFPNEPGSQTPATVFARDTCWLSLPRISIAGYYPRRLFTFATPARSPLLGPTSRTQMIAPMPVSFPSLRNDFAWQPSAFEESRAADDYPNAIARFAEMQRYCFDELSRRPE